MNTKKVFIIFITLIALFSGATANLDDFNKYKEISATDVSGQPTVDYVAPIYWTCGDDTTTGTGDVVLDCSNIDDKTDIAVQDTDETYLDYEHESFDSTSGGVLWVYDSWKRDGNVDAYITYGKGNTDESSGGNGANPWSNGNYNMIQHLNDNPITATDSSPNSNNGDVDSVSSINSVYDGGGSFDGSDSAILSTTNNIDVQNTWTQSAYIKPDDLGSEQNIIAPKGTDDGARNLRIMTGMDGTSGNIEFVIYDGSNNNFATIPSSDVSTGNTYLVTATYDYGKTEAKIYLNGDLKDTISVSPNAITIEGYSIGAYTDVDSDVAKDLDKGLYDGEIDEVKVIKSVKNSDWVTANYESSDTGGKTLISQSGSKTSGTPDPSISDVKFNVTERFNDTNEFGVWSQVDNINSSYTVHFKINDSDQDRILQPEERMFPTDQTGYTNSNYNYSSTAFDIGMTWWNETVDVNVTVQDSNNNVVDSFTRTNYTPNLMNSNVTIKDAFRKSKINPETKYDDFLHEYAGYHTSIPWDHARMFIEVKKESEPDSDYIQLTESINQFNYFNGTIVRSGTQEIILGGAETPTELLGADENLTYKLEVDYYNKSESSTYRSINTTATVDATSESPTIVGSILSAVGDVLQSILDGILGIIDWLVSGLVYVVGFLAQIIGFAITWIISLITIIITQLIALIVNVSQYVLFFHADLDYKNTVTNTTYDNLSSSNLSYTDLIEDEFEVISVENQSTYWNESINASQNNSFTNRTELKEVAVFDAGFIRETFENDTEEYQEEDITANESSSITLDVSDPTHDQGFGYEDYTTDGISKSFKTGTSYSTNINSGTKDELEKWQDRVAIDVDAGSDFSGSLSYFNGYNRSIDHTKDKHYIDVLISDTAYIDCEDETAKWNIYFNNANPGYLTDADVSFSANCNGYNAGWQNLTFEKIDSTTWDIVYEGSGGTQTAQVSDSTMQDSSITLGYKRYGNGYFSNHEVGFYAIDDDFNSDPPSDGYEISDDPYVASIGYTVPKRAEKLGLPFGVPTLINIVLVVLSLIVALVPNTVWDALTYILNLGVWFIDYIIFIGKLFFGFFTWIGNQGVQRIKELLYLSLLVLGARYVSVFIEAYKGQRSIMSALEYMISDMFQKYERAERIMYRAIDSVTNMAKLFVFIKMTLLKLYHTIRDSIPFI